MTWWTLPGIWLLVNALIAVQLTPQIRWSRKLVRLCR